MKMRNHFLAELKELMGKSEYDLFIEMGRKMFA
jgi:hypothetical protein